MIQRRIIPGILRKISLRGINKRSLGLVNQTRTHYIGSTNQLMQRNAVHCRNISAFDHTHSRFSTSCLATRFKSNDRACNLSNYLFLGLAGALVYGLFVRYQALAEEQDDSLELLDNLHELHSANVTKELNFNNQHFTWLLSILEYTHEKESEYLRLKELKDPHAEELSYLGTKLNSVEFIFPEEIISNYIENKSIPKSLEAYFASVLLYLAENSKDTTSMLEQSKELESQIYNQIDQIFDLMGRTTILFMRRKLNMQDFYNNQVWPFIYLKQQTNKCPKHSAGYYKKNIDADLDFAYEIMPTNSLKNIGLYFDSLNNKNVILEFIMARIYECYNSSDKLDHRFIIDLKSELALIENKYEEQLKLFESNLQRLIEIRKSEYKQNFVRVFSNFKEKINMIEAVNTEHSKNSHTPRI